MVQPGKKLELAEILQVIRQTNLELQVMRRVLERCEERADSVQQYLSALEASLAAQCVATSPVRSIAKCLGIGSAPRTNSEPWAVLESLAKTGIDRLEIEWLATGAALVRVNDGKPFKLAPALAHLLEILAQDSPVGNGAIVEWKSYPAVAGMLEKKLGRQYTKHAINQLVFRLRRVLVGTGEHNPFLIQTHRQFGLRFALKHKEKL